ncbi:aminopeptidase N-like [Penaeus indicus]|uniref:aminopeptidase N-like n=1 Tax=Penaeus indicus TaxID=29960 RepID=UPI00300CB1CB
MRISILFFIIYGTFALKGVNGMETQPSGMEIQAHNSVERPLSTEELSRTPKSPEAISEVDTRLPTSLKPLRYRIRLQPFVNGNFSIFGFLEVEMEVLETTYNITLHMLDIITKNDTVKVLGSGGVEQRQVGIKSQHYDPVRQFYVAQMEEALMKGERYTLQMEFLGYLNDQLRGFYRSTYKDVDGNSKYFAVTQFQSTHARRAFPCFDEPALKATFEVHLARETWMTSLSNMPLAATRPAKGQEGWVWDRFERSVPMSTYLVAFVVSDFSYIASSSGEGILFRVWAQPSAIRQAEYISQLGSKILAFYEAYFNVSYPLPKMDMVAVPELQAQGMENWGLITLRDRIVLYDPDVNSVRAKEKLVEVVTHELAHQWFGNLVTPFWWDDLWLNEGFATFVSFVGSAHAEPSWKKMEKFTTEVLQKVFETDGLESSHQISLPVNNASEISEIFDGIEYNKGASIIRMMMYFLGEYTFRKGLNSYLNAFAYSNAEQDDLWEHLTAAAHRDRKLPESLSVKTIMDTWTLQKGFPVVKVARSSDGTSADVSQEHFLLMKEKKSCRTQDLRWWVPLSYTSQGEANFDQTEAIGWMKDSDQRISITSLPPKDQWVIFNLQQTGYYRVNYDDHNWNLLIQQLKDDHEVIHIVNRAQIIDDAMNLARAGQLSYTIALDVFAYLGKEREHLPWMSGVSNLSYVILMFQRTRAFPALKLRGIRIISPNRRSEVMCTAIKAGGEREWNFVWNEYLSSNAENEKISFLEPLGCSRNVTILSRYLEIGLNPSMGTRKDDFKIIFNSVAKNSIGRQIAWTFLTKRWNDILPFAKRKRGMLLRQVTLSFNTPRDIKDLEHFLQDRNTDLAEVTKTADQVKERARNNVMWMEKNFHEIVEFLEDHGYASPKLCYGIFKSVVIVNLLCVVHIQFSFHAFPGTGSFLTGHSFRGKPVSVLHECDHFIEQKNMFRFCMLLLALPMYPSTSPVLLLRVVVMRRPPPPSAAMPPSGQGQGWVGRCRPGRRYLNLPACR